MNRRFLNLIVKSGDAGYTLRRLNLSPHLFHLSTAAAEEAAAAATSAKAKKQVHGADLPADTERLGRPPAPRIRFRSPHPGLEMDFALGGRRRAQDPLLRRLRPRRAAPREPLVADPIFFDVTGFDAADGLYAMSKATDPYSGGSFEPWLWDPVPPPPTNPREPYIIRCSVLVSGGATICVTAYSYMAMKPGATTLCFDTARREWNKAGDWELPFYGRGENAPELNGLWFGL
ncbi:hypothetical protein E2562_038879 [Oryza meyeriana var. granulata]|uniref:Uncharacterized protein n=1 Tax=Oryza meyeriana var. granulata TaxID=110450 RepID=A0A6G1CM90_9ORYZ|nr:hypothetical protein E2562_038879 [Oryza meyeriana var. granulata]